MMFSQRIFDEKQALRENLLKRADALEPEIGQIAKSVMKLPVWQSAKSVFCFASYGYEPNTEPLIEDAIKTGKSLCVPLCKKGGLMKAVHIDSPENLKRGFYGILEPPENGKALPPTAFDLIIIPCLAADKSKNRLGKGGGYYDRFLAQCAPNCTKLLLCRKELLLEAVPFEPHDIKADILICE